MKRSLIFFLLCVHVSNLWKFNVLTWMREAFKELQVRLESIGKEQMTKSCHINTSHAFFICVTSRTATTGSPYAYYRMT